LNGPPPPDFRVENELHAKGYRLIAGVDEVGRGALAGPVMASAVILPPGARFGLIVANPPYLSADEVAQAAPEVRAHEPMPALVSAGDGLADLREILTGAPRFLAPGGWLALETGIAQHAELARLAAAAGFKRTESLPDLTGRDRYLLAWLE